MSWNVCCQLVTKLYQQPESSQQIAKYLLYHHASPAVLHNSGMFYLREVSKGKGLSLAPIIEGECVSAWDHPSGPLPPSCVCLSTYLEQKTGSFGILANLIMSPIIKDGCQDSKRRG